MDFIALLHDPLSVEKTIQLVSDSSCGAISSFIGTTRDNFEGLKVCKLEYEAYEDMAVKEIKKICQKAREKWNLKNIAIYHRLGAVDIKEASVIIAVSSEHRKESLDAVSFIIDTLKASVPIWKKEVYDSGSSEWKRNKECIWTKDKEPSEIDTQMDCHQLEYLIQNKEKDNSSNKLPLIAKSNDEGKYQDSADQAFVQIIATKEEIKRRIEAFQKLKREELNVLNIQDFCTQHLAEEEESCARTSAVILRLKDSSTHLKLTKVINEWGPQTDGIDPGSQPNNQPCSPNEERVKILTNTKSEFKEGMKNCLDQVYIKNKKRKLPESLEERLTNMEEHLDIRFDSRVPGSVFKRIKDLENRILFLESISPEYFSYFPKNHDSNYLPPKTENMELEEEDHIILDTIDQKLFALKKKMKMKQLGVKL